MQYLMIRNPGVAPTEGFTCLGVSTTRFAGSSQTIGQFGSGSKHAVNLLLRNNINPVIFAGNLKLEFFTKPMLVNDGLIEHDYSRVCVKYGGQDQDGKNRSATEDLSITLEHGVQDWNDLAMGLREFVSNALDRTFRETHSFANTQVEIADKPRAKAGHTTVYVPLTPEVQKFYNEINKRFLHFREPHNLTEKILSKANRNLDNEKGAMVYKKGVFIRCFKENDLESVFDYNLGDELPIDESRNTSDYAVKGAISQAIANALAKDLIPVMRKVIAGEKTLEVEQLDSFRLKNIYADEVVKKKQQEQWAKAWNAVAGENSVAVADKPELGNYVEKKGYRVKTVKNETWFAALEEHGILTDNKVLTEQDKKGTTFFDATPDMIQAVNKVWNILESYDMLNGRAKPPIKAYHEVMTAETQRLGYYNLMDRTVCLHTDLGVGQSPILLQTALEEVVHHVTGAGDMSRDLQDFLFRLVVKMAL